MRMTKTQLFHKHVTKAVKGRQAIVVGLGVFNITVAPLRPRSRTVVLDLKSETGKEWQVSLTGPHSLPGDTLFTFRSPEVSPFWDPVMERIRAYYPNIPKVQVGVFNPWASFLQLQTTLCIPQTGALLGLKRKVSLYAAVRGTQCSAVVHAVTFKTRGKALSYWLGSHDVSRAFVGITYEDVVL